LHLPAYSHIFHYAKLILLYSTVTSSQAALAPPISCKCLCLFVPY
jgi:hypothetical protein